MKNKKNKIIFLSFPLRNSTNILLFILNKTSIISSSSDFHNYKPSTVNRSRREHITSGYLQTDCILQSKTLSVFTNLGNHKGLPLPSTLSVSSTTVAQQVIQQSDRVEVFNVSTSGTMFLILHITYLVVHKIFTRQTSSYDRYINC
jgi:hypothetical protein